MWCDMEVKQMTQDFTISTNPDREKQLSQSFEDEYKARKYDV